MDDNSILEKQAALQEYREASLLFRDGEYERAIVMLERLLAVYPKHETVRTALAMCRAAIAKRDREQAAANANEPAESKDVVKEIDEDEPVVAETEPNDGDNVDETTDEEPCDESDEETEEPPALHAVAEYPEDVIDESILDTYDEPPTPTPFVYEFSTPAPPGRANDPWWRIPAAIAVGICVGMYAGIKIKDARATWQSTGSASSALHIDATILPDTADLAALEANAPDVLRLTDDARGAIEASEDRGEFTTPTGPSKTSRVTGDWKPIPAWTKDGVTAWTSAYGDFYVYVPDSPRWVTVMVHGAPENPEERGALALDLLCRPLVQRYADGAQSVVVTPVFDATRYRDYGHLSGSAVSADAFVTAIVDSLVESYGIAEHRAIFYGHSAGAQFVHRYMLIHPERVLRAALSAPGAYVMPDDDRTWPDGLTGCPNPQAYRWAARIPTLVVVGDGDPRRETARAWLRAVNNLAENQSALVDVKLVPQAAHRESHLLGACLEFMVP